MTMPSDYEACGDCGFDHGYEQAEAVRAHRKPTPPPDTLPTPPIDSEDRARLQSEIEAFTMAQWLIKDCRTVADVTRMLGRAIDARRTRLARNPKQ